ncbi:zinc finger BED domain-containing protein 1-like [Rhizophagus clarus]|uniref:Zinc finger BED domain-containing protein 1-like n=1 Tax=Rhizophagus clarus TaxID=94130 RepID=A0A8H3L7V3_9GLOM|nr:zinc finger BED domain-containing protein 1-like [Rhizophagus clarus]
MENNNDQDYIITLSENEGSSDEIVEITPTPLAKKQRGRPAKLSKALGKQKMTNTTLESTDRAPNDSNPFKQTAAIIKPQTKFLLDDGKKCSKNYKYDGKELSTLRWILLTTQPLSTITQKAYIEHMYIIDPQFTVPGEKKLRMMIARSYEYNKEKLKLLLKTAQSISLTTDLWSSCSKYGYLGLTATWINKNFEIMDVLLEISYFPTPHTAKAITEGIKNAMQKWEIENLIVSITIDNGANVVAAIRDLTPIKRLSCAAHTLQLAISKGLKVVENLVSRTKQLINFFSTQKQIERLIKVQKEIGYEEPLHLIQDISTRWNSSYLAWDRLIFLQYVVLQLSVNLSCSLISEEKTDGIRLKKIMIKDNEWELLDELCNILAPFEKATRDFSGNTYVTLSQMFPIITDLTNSLKPSDNSYEVLEDSDDNTINSDIVEEESSQIEVDYTDEITTYFLLPVARENKNPLDWWKSKQEIFPVLSIIARKYLGIPATSVASERLFSDAGNHITAKRSLLDPALLGKIVFLKCNMKTMDHINIFPPDLDVENNDYVEDEHELEELLDE